ncbi:FemAB family XrtA/PEP-CTERM system-associated protein [Sphingosinicella sp. BN140058]|uniref:FemAB family XrtA/PEP-CTERM system-associated protein n=1 Tax=Sphingosinicella sp. BN140058 TaxID=1892855 RepID=UPI001012C700|nr:FemAB family XrtA/PEP-CTERM system-associated protein [Sphingosinicella sp. BN140058]QAY79162.1 FemAB family PEP-CTERM system-associated protein [Sphingosinicella sp. BN140058]
MNALTPIRTVRAATPADYAAVAAFVRGHPDAEPFHLPAWSSAVERGCGQAAHILVAEDVVGKIRGVLPLSEMRSPLFGSALVSTGFGVGGGILGDGGDALADAAWSLAQARGCASVELRGGVLPTDWARCGNTYAGFVRDLPSAEDAILQAIPRKQRAEVRRSLTLGLEVSVGRDQDAHYRVYSESVRNLGTPVFPCSLFAAMLEAFGDDADILVVRKDGVPVAAVLSLYFRGTVFPYWGGGTAAARALRANECMYFALMRHAAARGCNRFDFGRSKLGTGAYAFKKNWGFAPQPLVYATKGEARQTNPLSPKYRLQVAAWKKMPLWLANRIGPPIARGLG